MDFSYFDTLVIMGRTKYDTGTNGEKSKGREGGPEGSRTFPKGTAPRESLSTGGTSRGQIFQTIPED